MTEKKITVGIIQQQNTGDIADNKKRLKHHIEQCAAKGAQLVVLQELHNSLYFCQTESTDNFDLAESIPGESTEFYSRIAGELHIVLVTSLFERRTAGLYHNTAVVFDTDGSIAGKYRKMHIPDDPAYYEKFYFTPGDLGFTPIKTSIGTLGVLVCWDMVSRSSPPHGATRSRHAHLPYGHRLGEFRHPPRTKTATRRVGHFPTRTCCCQRTTCCSCQPCGT